MIGLTMLLLGGIWALRLLIKKAVECFKWGSIGHPIEGSGAKDVLNCEGLAHEFSEENFSMLPRDYSCNILVKNMLPFAHIQRICLKLK